MLAREQIPLLLVAALLTACAVPRLDAPPTVHPTAADAARAGLRFCLERVHLHECGGVVYPAPGGYRFGRLVMGGVRHIEYVLRASDVAHFHTHPEHWDEPHSPPDLRAVERDPLHRPSFVGTARGTVFVYEAGDSAPRRIRWKEKVALAVDRTPESDPSADRVSALPGPRRGTDSAASSPERTPPSS